MECGGIFTISIFFIKKQNIPKINMLYVSICYVYMKDAVLFFLIWGYFIIKNFNQKGMRSDYALSFLELSSFGFDHIF